MDESNAKALFQQQIPCTFLELQEKIGEKVAEMKEAGRAPIMEETEFRRTFKDMVEDDEELLEAIYFLNLQGLSICLSVCQCSKVCQSVCQSAVCLSVLQVCQSVYLSVQQGLSICLSVNLSFCLSVLHGQSICLSVSVSYSHQPNLVIPRLRYAYTCLLGSLGYLLKASIFFFCIYIIINR